MLDTEILDRPVRATEARAEPLLQVEQLTVALPGGICAVDGVALAIAPGETLGLVGESGCGKSLTCLAIAGLLPAAARVTGGRVLLGGRDLLALGPQQMATARGRDVAMVYQDPLAALNPVMTIGRQIAEGLVLHGQGHAVAMAEARRLLDRVGMPAAASRLGAYPHELSGGMNQRAVIAMALACRPRLLIADEPTTALDVTIQAQILDLLRDVQREYGMALLLVTHDLGVVAEMADTVAVMYAGRVVEQAPVSTLFATPGHPYAAGLLACLPRIEHEAELRPIPGAVPPLGRLPAGCAYAPRCPVAAGPCFSQRPDLGLIGPGSFAACHHARAA